MNSQQPNIIPYNLGSEFLSFGNKYCVYVYITTLFDSLTSNNEPNFNRLSDLFGDLERLALALHCCSLVHAACALRVKQKFARIQTAWLRTKSCRRDTVVTIANQTCAVCILVA